MNNYSRIILLIKVLVFCTAPTPAQLSQTGSGESSVSQSRPISERAGDQLVALPRQKIFQKDILGWQDARWGMTEADIVKTFSASLKKLPKRALYKNVYVDYVITDLKLNRENFTVHFQMDTKTNRLAQLLIRLDQMKSDSPRNDAFLGLEELLSQKYGTPSYKRDEMEYLISRTRQWTFPTTTIELSYGYIRSISSSLLTIRYFQASSSDTNKL